jgi:hypothetical protein
MTMLKVLKLYFVRIHLLIDVLNLTVIDKIRDTIHTLSYEKKHEMLDLQS